MIVVVVVARADVEVARWTIDHDGGADLTLVDELARLELGARRLDLSVRVETACPRLGELLALVGLGSVVSVVEVRREPEDLEQVGVEEVVMPDDPIA